MEGQCWLTGLIGRYGNRIAGGKFSLNGTDYQLPVNVGPNYCHGGFVGYHQVEKGIPQCIILEIPDTQSMMAYMILTK